MNLRRWIGALLTVVAVSGCDVGERAPTDDDKALQRAIEAPQDKARAVEQQLQQDQQRKRQQIDDQSG